MNLENRPYMQNREIAWLRFNERVLDEAQMNEVPLLEKLKFISIFVSNLDEFFMVRVGTLRELHHLKKEILDNKTNMTPKEQIEKILEIIPTMYNKKDVLYSKVMTALKQSNIRSLTYEQLNEEQTHYANHFFKEQIEQLISPQIIDISHPLPFLDNKKNYIITRLEKEGQIVFGLVKISDTYPEMLLLPGHEVDFILIEQLILAKIDHIFKGYSVVSKNIIAVTRNTDVHEDEDTQALFDDYKDYMKFIIKKRKKLSAIRLESLNPLPKHVKSYLLGELKLTEQQYFVSSAPLTMKFITPLIEAVPSAMKDELLYKKINAYNPFENLPSIITEIRKKDQLLSYPYDDMAGFIQLLKEIANDPKCVAIKITIYRLAKNSQIVKYLCRAAENGKEVTVLLELKARFDEESNIRYSSILADSGCNIIYGFEEYKTHSKAFLAIFKDKRGNYDYITQIGTGNYNEITSRFYTDFSLITANREIGLDTSDFFKNLALGNLYGKYKQLLQAPSSLKQQFTELIDKEIKKGRNGFLFFKFNSLTDKKMIEKLKEASQNGVTIKLIIRGICCILPGVKGETDNIEIHNVVGRFLEHPRVFMFGKDDDSKMYIASADLMTRNMKKRVEIATPILDKDIKQRIFDYLNTQFQDTVKGRKLLSTGEYAIINDAVNTTKLSSQDIFIQEAERKVQNQIDQLLQTENNQPDTFMDHIKRLFKGNKLN